MALPFIIHKFDKPRKLRFEIQHAIEFQQLTGIDFLMESKILSLDECVTALYIMLKDEEPDLTKEKTYEYVNKYFKSFTEFVSVILKVIQNSIEGEKEESPNVKTPTAKD